MKKLVIATVIVAQSMVAVTPAHGARSDGSAGKKKDSRVQNAQNLALSDEGKANRLITAEAIYQVNRRNDSTMAFALYRSSMAKTPAEVTKIFESAGDGVQPFINRDQTVYLLKTAASLAGKGAVNPIIDVANDYTKKIEGGPGKMRLEDMPKDMATLMLVAGTKDLPEPVQKQLAVELAKRMGTNYDDAVKRVIENRVLADKPSTNQTEAKDPQRPLDQQVYDQGLAVVKERLDIQVQLLEDRANKQAASEELQRRKEEVELQGQHLQAGVFLASTLLGPIIGADAANKFSTVGKGLIEMNQAIKTFGPGGLSADKLLMCTNFVSAGLMIASVLSQPKEDPTMMALQQIMQQLIAMQKQLAQIEGKIDHLTDIVMMGFDRMMKGQASLSSQIEMFQKIVEGQISDDSKRRAVLEYIGNLKALRDGFRLAQTCAYTAGKPSTSDADQCMKDLSVQLADSTILTGVDFKNSPDVWSNLMLSHDFSDGEEGSLVLEQLSYPFFFLGNPAAFRGMIARNHEAVAAYGRMFLGLPHAQPISNPMALAPLLETYLAGAKIHAKLKTSVAAPITEQAIRRIDEIEAFVKASIGSKTTMDKIWNRLGRDSAAYEGVAKSIFQGLMTNPFTAAKGRFGPASLVACDGAGRTLDLHPAYLGPAPAGQPELDSFVPQIFWVAQELGLGTISQCYTLSSVPGSLVRDPRPQLAALQYYQVRYNVSVRFNPNHLEATLAPQDRVTVHRELPTNALPIAARTLTSQAHYTTWYGSTRPIYEFSWSGQTVGGVDGSHDVFEWNHGGGKNGPFDGNRYIPARAFMTESQSVLPEDQLRQSVQKVKTMVAERFQSLIWSRTQIWNPQTLGFDPLNRTGLMADAEAAQIQALSQTMASYQKRLLLAKSLLVTGYYHGAAVSGCLEELESRFSPQQAVGRAASRVLDPRVDFSTQLMSRMKSLTDSCLAKSIDPELLKLRERLVQLRALQGRN